jgi:hypothetical protein
VLRGPYEWTLASLETLLMSSTMEAALDAGAGPRWAGAALWRRSGFDDENVVTAASAWLLAPVTRGLRVGYAVSWQDARHSRWTPTSAGGSGEAFLDAPLPGRYQPYYTPADVLVQTLMVEGSRSVGRARLRAQVGYGFSAREEAPAFWQDTASPLLPALLTWHRRSFSPWSARASLAHPIGAKTALELGGEYNEGAYYRLGTLTTELHWRWR